MKRHHDATHNHTDHGNTPPDGKPGDAAVPDTVTLSRAAYEALQKKEAESKESQERCARVQADFENSRRRLERDKLEFAKYANEEIIGELIPFVDDFQRAFAAADTTHDFQVLHKGVEMILNHLLQLLKRHGVTPIEALGKKFDPQFHEALLQVETTEQPEDTVIEELQKGYTINGRVLRTAKVKVAKAPDAPAEESRAADGT